MTEPDDRSQPRKRKRKKKRKLKMPRELQREVVRRYQAGRSISRVAREVGWSERTIRRVLAQHGVPRRPPAKHGPAPDPTRFHYLDPKTQTSPPVAVPADTQREIVRRYEAGESIARIAREVHWGTMTVWRVLVHNDVPRRKRGTEGELRKAEEVKQTVALYREYQSVTRVARELGIGVSTVTYRLQRAGAERRPRWLVNTVTSRRPKPRPLVNAILDVLEEGGPMTVGAIHERIGASHGSVYTSLLRLSKREIVRPTPPLSEGRSRGRIWARTGRSRDYWPPLPDVRVLRPEEVRPVGPRLPIGPFREWLLGLLEGGGLDDEEEEGGFLDEGGEEEKKAVSPGDGRIQRLADRLGG